MKSRITFLAALLFLCVASAQNNFINYKALVKDNLGNIVANQSIDVRFTIFSNFVQVYQETHNPTTDANGIVILDIGIGITSNVFDDINWSTYTTLQTEIDLGSGFVDLGTTEFRTVPYAFNAANVSGLETLDEGNGFGWRLVGRDPGNYGNIGWNGVDLSHSTNFTNELGATGNYSFASGINVKASGRASFAFGDEAFANADYAIALGTLTEASEYSTAIGNFAKATGNGSIAIGDSQAIGEYSRSFGFGSNSSADRSTTLGYFTLSESYLSTALGSYNIGGGDPENWVATDPLFEIGNGSNDANRANALTVLKNGNTQISGRLSVGTNIIGTLGSLAIKGDNNNDMIQLIDNNGNNKWHIGLKSSGDDISFSESLVADGRLYLQKGGNIGINTTSPQNELHIMGGGDASLANGSGFFQIGSETGENLVFDTNEIIARNTGLASDLYLQAEGGNTRIGGPGGAPTHTLTVLGDAKVTNAIEGPEPAISGIKNYHSPGILEAVGVLGQNTVNPAWGVGVEGQGGFMGVKGVAMSNDDGAFSNVGTGGFAEGSNSGENYGVYGSAADGATNYAVYANGNLAYTGTLINASDRKVKTNISTIYNSLQDIMRLNPTSYLIKENYQKTMNMSSSPQFGFIAQELQEVFPDLVSKNKHPGATMDAAPIDYLGVNYIGLIPILTKGIQEQQQLIEKQNERIAVLEAQNKKLLKDSAELDSIKQDIQLLKAQLGVIKKSEAMTKLNTEN